MSETWKSERQAVYHSLVDGAPDRAIAHLLKVLRESSGAPRDCANLAFVLFNYCDDETIASTAEQLREWGLSSSRKHAAVFLDLSLKLALEAPDIESQVRVEYLDKILRRRIRKTAAKPIVFWHIPKCSGTSINDALGSHFYFGPIAEIVPGYTFRPLALFLGRSMLDDIPYLPSMHFAQSELQVPDWVLQFTVLRDPVRRALSMYRQEAVAHQEPGHESPDWRHYHVLPRYGFFWDYRGDEDFDCWLENIPDDLLLRQLSTFSKTLTLSSAMDKVASLDYVLTRDFSHGSDAELLSLLGVEQAAVEVSEGTNRSDKSIEIPSHGKLALQTRLSPEYQLIGHVVAGLNV